MLKVTLGTLTCLHSCSFILNHENSCGIKKLQAQIQKISKSLSEQYFEKYSLLTLCLDDWMCKYKSPEYSQLIKMEEQHILKHVSSLLLSFLWFYNIVNVFSLYSCHLINLLQQKYQKVFLHKILSHVPSCTIILISFSTYF